MNHKFLPVVSSLLTMTLLVSNTLDTKIFTLGGLELPGGIILFPLAYLSGDVLTEVYGFAAARRVIWSGLLALVIMIFAYELARRLPPADVWKNQAAFDAIFSHVPRIVMGSICAYICGEFTNSYVIAKLKVRTKGKFMALRFVASTVAGEFVDTTVFVTVAFVGVFSPSELIALVASAWAVKVGWEIIALPLTLPLVRLLKRVENEDYYDFNTDFNPLKI